MSWSPRYRAPGADGPGSWRGAPGTSAGGKGSDTMASTPTAAGTGRRPQRSGPWEPSVTNLLGLVVLEMLLFTAFRIFFRKMGA